jgi:hypothetical protein
MSLSVFNSDNCHSVKSKKNLNEQCNCKPKNGYVLCGKHLNNKNKIYFNIIHENQSNIVNNIDVSNDTNDNISNHFIDDVINNSSNLNDMDNLIQLDELNQTNHGVEKEVLTKNELFEMIQNNSYLSVFMIRKSIKYNHMNHIINTKQSKSLLISELKKMIEKERYYLSNQNSLILIQKTFRMWLIRRRKICNNDTDILTFISIYDIPNIYFYSFYDSISKKRYGYDIRTLYQIIHSEYPSCPYTLREFTEYEKESIQFCVGKLKNKYNISIEIEKPHFTPEEEVEMKMKDIFHKINMLDNYTSYLWFKNLHMYQLVDLYIKMEDIWNYRSSMDIESKCKIVKNGIAFSIPFMSVKHIKSKLIVQNILLDEFYRLITEGVDREEKKLGAILILTGLVEVSVEASDALPHLIQV